MRFVIDTQNIESHELTIIQAIQDVAQHRDLITSSSGFDIELDDPTDTSCLANISDELIKAIVGFAVVETLQYIVNNESEKI